MRTLFRPTGLGFTVLKNRNRVRRSYRAVSDVFTTALRSAPRSACPPKLAFATNALHCKKRDAVRSTPHGERLPLPTDRRRGGSCSQELAEVGIATANYWSKPRKFVALTDCHKLVSFRTRNRSRDPNRSG